MSSTNLERINTFMILQWLCILYVLNINHQIHDYTERNNQCRALQANECSTLRPIYVVKP